MIQTINMTDSGFIHSVTSEILSQEYIALHVVPALRPHTESRSIVKMPFLDLEIYFRVMVRESEQERSSYILTQQHMAACQMDLPFLRACAIENVRSSITCRTMAETLGALDLCDTPDLYVLTTQNTYHGAAAALLCTDALQKLAADLRQARLFILPSSVHEVLALDPSYGEPAELNRMIKEINATQVVESERLSDHLYIYDAATNCVTMP